MSSIIPPTSITPVRCPAKGCPWAAHGIPDKYTEARAWHLAAHRAEEHGKPLTAEQIAYGQSKGYRMPETQDATTPAPLSPEREAEWRAYADAATDGPWGTHRDLRGTYTIHTRPRITPTGLESDGHIATLANGGTDAETYATARLMAAAPEAVRALLAELDEARVWAGVLEQQAATATEYRVPAPDGPALIVRRSPLGSGQWAAFEARILGSGRRCWTRDGWQTVKHLAPSETYCWPDATTALAEARKAVHRPADGEADPGATLQPLTDYDDGLGPVWPHDRAGEPR